MDSGDRNFRNDLKIAALAAAAAVAGTVVGGLISYQTNRDLQERDFRRAAHVRLEQAHAAAAVERSRFVVAGRALGDMTTVKLYLVEEDEGQISIADRALVLGYLKPPELEEYALARRCLFQLAASLRGRRTGEEIGDIALMRLKAFIPCVAGGEKALRRLANLNTGTWPAQVA